MQQSMCCTNKCRNTSSICLTSVGLYLVIYYVVLEVRIWSVRRWTNDLKIIQWTYLLQFLFLPSYSSCSCSALAPWLISQHYSCIGWADAQQLWGTSRKKVGWVFPLHWIPFWQTRGTKCASGDAFQWCVSESFLKLHWGHVFIK